MTTLGKHWIRKIPVWNKGKKTGQSVWRGKHRPKDTCDKISRTLKGRKLPLETRLKIGIAIRSRPTKKIEKYCEICGNKMMIPPSLLRIKYCSRGCFNKSRLNRKLSEQHKLNISKSLIGVNNWSSGANSTLWKGGISFEPYSPEWTRKLKKQVRERDNYKCAICGKYGKDVHHIDYNKKNCSVNNLITLCSSHHTKTTHGDRKMWMKILKQMIST